MNPYPSRAALIGEAAAEKRDLLALRTIAALRQAVATFRDAVAALPAIDHPEVRCGFAEHVADFTAGMIDDLDATGRAIRNTTYVEEAA